MFHDLHMILPRVGDSMPIISTVIPVGWNAMVDKLHVKKILVEQEKQW
jgi:hypothetical protein